jgi:hypothetical protein
MYEETRIITPEGGHSHERILDVLCTIHCLDWLDYRCILVRLERRASTEQIGKRLDKNSYPSVTNCRKTRF